MQKDNQIQTKETNRQKDKHRAREEGRTKKGENSPLI